MSDAANTDLQQQTSAESERLYLDILKGIRALRSFEGWKAFGKNAGLAVLVGAAIGLLILIPFAVGHVWAAGLGPAWRAYWRWWVAAPLFGAAGLVAFMLGVAFVDGILAGATFVVRRTLSPIIPGAAKWTIQLGSAWGVVVVVWLALTAFGSGAASARKRVPAIDGNPDKTVAATTAALGSQQQAAERLSQSAVRLIEDIDQTLAQMQGAKTQLRETLEAIELQQAAVAKTGNELRAIDAQRADLERTTGELRRYLGGKDPITKEDLDRSGNVGLAAGLVLGFFLNIAANWVWERMKRPRTKEP